MFGRFAHCRTATTLGLNCNIAPLPCCCDSHTPMLRVCFFRYQVVRLPPVSVFTALVPQSRSGEQHTWCSHCVSRVACRLRARGRGWATHGLLTEVSTGVPWVSCRDPPVCSRCPGSMASVAERQLVLCWSVCCGARTRSVEYAVSTFCTVFSHTPPRHRHDCGSVDLERNFAPLVTHHSLTRLFADFTSLHPLYCWLDRSQKRHISTWTRFWLWLLWLQPARCIYNVLHHSVHTFRWWHMVHLIVQQLIDHLSVLQHNLYFLHVFGF